MLELHVSSNDVTSGSVGIGWCVSPDTLKMLSDRRVKNPGIVLVTAPKGSLDKSSPDYKEFRTVVPLKDLVGYVSFKTPGQNNIWGFLVSNIKQAKEKFLEKHHISGWERPILNDEATDWPQHNLGRLNPGYDPYFHNDEIKELISEPVEVYVPKECFAPEPAEWEKTWVNYFFTRRVMDQCEFRRRRMLAYTVQPIVVLFNILARFVLLVLSTLFGLRGWSIQPLLHPLMTPFADAIEVVDPNHGTYFIGRGGNQVVNWLRLPFMPISLFGMFLLCKFHAVAGAGLIALGILLLAAFIMGCYVLFAMYMERLDRIERTSEAWFMKEDELQYIVCSTSNVKATSLSQLPSKKRTFRLRFQDLKTQVCRPFSA